MQARAGCRRGEGSGERRPAERRTRLRGPRLAVEESREAVVVLDGSGVVVASRRARQALASREGRPLHDDLLGGETRSRPVRRGRPAGAARLSLPARRARAYEELRAGFTAAVSHELRTPLARLMALLETARAPGRGLDQLVEQAAARSSVRELIDEVLFLAELESGRGSSPSGRGRCPGPRRRRCGAGTSGRPAPV